MSARDDGSSVTGERAAQKLSSKRGSVPVDGAHEIGSHAVPLIAKYMLDAGAHLRAGNLNQPEMSGNRSI